MAAASIHIFFAPPINMPVKIAIIHEMYRGWGLFQYLTCRQSHSYSTTCLDLCLKGRKMECHALTYSIWVEVLDWRWSMPIYSVLFI